MYMVLYILYLVRNKNNIRLVYIAQIKNNIVRVREDIVLFYSFVLLVVCI